MYLFHPQKLQLLRARTQHLPCQSRLRKHESLAGCCVVDVPRFFSKKKSSCMNFLGGWSDGSDYDL